MVQDTSNQILMIRDKLLRAQNRQKSYYDNKHRPLEFDVGEHVFLKLSPVAAVGWALNVRKLSPRFIGPCQIIQRIEPVAYRLFLLPHLSGLHDVFHVSQLRSYIPDPSHVVEPDTVQIRKNLTNLI
ncbi:uncharacterized protein LOC133305026 [Gastrolobium bilobum]|uniref:uncharacterized protein LOC133305026 n=1 Tax=Gastrolobium bilobum TaxID=150636 RepID=UPI002AB275F4|nr:uncharacterized protein LOC133305026 [Gastrolobium bilobum]